MHHSSSSSSSSAPPPALLRRSSSAAADDATGFSEHASTPLRQLVVNGNSPLLSPPAPAVAPTFREGLALLKPSRHFDANAAYWLAGTAVISVPLVVFISDMLSRIILPDFGSVEPLFRVYRLLLVLPILSWLWLLDTWVWAAFNVDYVRPLGFHARHHNAALRFACLTTVLWLLSATAYLLSRTYLIHTPYATQIPQYTHASLLLAVFVALLLCQAHYSDVWLFSHTARTLAAPFFFVLFGDLLVGDYLTSMHVPLYDLEWTVCWYTTGEVFGNSPGRCASYDKYTQPLLALMPYVWRLLQCVRHLYNFPAEKMMLVNIGKYATAGVVSLLAFGEVFDPNLWYYWVALYCVATLYQFCWDSFRDWKLRPFRLREQLYYPVAFYYVAMALNFVARWAWLATLKPSEQPGNPFYWSSLWAIIEIIRRAHWAIYRIEVQVINELLASESVQAFTVNADSATDIRKPLLSSQHPAFEAYRQQYGSASIANGNNGDSAPTPPPTTRTSLEVDAAQAAMLVSRRRSGLAAMDQRSPASVNLPV